MLLAQFYYYLYRKNEIFLTDIHRWNFTRAQGQEESIASLKQIDEHLKRTTTTSTNDKNSTSSNTTTQHDNDKTETSSTLNFTAGDRCLVYLLESEAGQLLNGQHVNLVDGITREGRLRCRFEDGTIRNVKLNNLKMKNNTDN